MAPSHRVFLRYLAMLLGVVVVIAGACLGFNALVDPLWYFNGNVVSGVNYTFNERLAKMNRLLPRLAQYDCLILGSSTAALLPQRQIHPQHCFNLSFSSGVVSELLLYAKYLRARDFHPKLLIVGVDEFDFEGPTVPPDVPDFIRTGANPPSFWRTYLSLDTLDFSYRTLKGDYPNKRLYDREFESHIIARRHPHKPPKHLAAEADPPQFHPERAALYVELRRTFPEARAIGFVAPTAAWTIAQLELDGRLDAYLGALHRVSTAYDEFLDFSIPSEVTAGMTYTYDGLHYKDAVNEHTLAALMSGQAGSGVDWKKESPTEIAAAYRERIDRFVLHPGRSGQSPARAASPGGPAAVGQQ
jgi:hypothetical protein